MRNRFINLKYAVMCGLAVIAAASLAGYAQSTAVYEPNAGHVQGFLYTEDGRKPMTDAWVKMEQLINGKSNGKEFKSNVTGQTGEYRMENLPVGLYLVKIMIGNKEHKDKKLHCLVNVMAGETNNVSFTLKGIRRQP